MLIPVSESMSNEGEFGEGSPEAVNAVLESPVESY